MKIAYISNSRIPTEKAHGIQIMKMCEAFANAGNEVELIIPRRLNSLKDNPFKYFDVKENFKIKKLPTIDLVKFGKLGFWIQNVYFAKFSTLYCLIKKQDIIYSRDEVSLFLLSFFKKNFVYEAHINRWNFLIRRVFNKSKGIICISQGLKDFYIDKGVDENKILVAHDGVDLEKFDIKISKEDARKKLGLPLDKKIVMYTGHLYGWKGVDTLAMAGAGLTDDFIVVFVGGTDDEISQFKKTYTDNKILILGQKPYKDIPIYLKSADLLVIPNSAKSEVSKKYTSPMKLFEYIASGNNILSADLPSLREILSFEMGFEFFRPDDHVDLREKIDEFNFSNNIDPKSEVFSWEDRVFKINFFLKVLNKFNK